MDNGLQSDVRPVGFPLLSASVDALLWSSPRADQESAWHGHVSFAHWIVQTLCPATIVELGTHNGVSYAAFCNSVQRCGLDTKCYAVDTWMGDAHAGSYGETIYTKMDMFNRERFAAFSTLMRCRFNEALPSFADKSVDLLHIDGLHTLEAVSDDFCTWLPKLSDKAVVLFHDTAVRERDFGVWQLWGGLIKQYPHFTFRHSAGLGVLAVGPSVPKTILELCALDEFSEGDLVRTRFERASQLAFESGRLEMEARRQQLLRSLRFNGNNVALNCHATQSSGFSNSQVTPEGAVNGVRTGGYGFHTESEANPWWMVDLGRPIPILEIVVFNRLDGDCAGRARNLVVLASLDGETWLELHRTNGRIFGGVDGNPLRVPCEGTTCRFVRLKLDGADYFHLDEVEVYSKAAATGF
jgi:hypothetical protein